jgi:hypothetical protein
MYLLLGAIPFMALCLTMDGENSRHPLPAIVLLAMASVLAVLSVAAASRIGIVALSIFMGAVLGQWSMNKLAEVPRTGEWLRSCGASRVIRTMIPAVDLLRPSTHTDIDWVMDYAGTIGPSMPREWLLSGDESEISVPRLKLAAYIRGLPMRFDYAEYFNWSPEFVRQRIDQAATGRAMLIVATETERWPGTEFLRGNAPLVLSALDRFRYLGSHGGVSLYCSKTASDIPEPPAPAAITVTPHDGQDLQILKHQLNGCTLTVNVQSARPVSCSLKLFAHAFDLRGHMKIWDQALAPRACEWQGTGPRTLSFSLPSGCRKDLDRLEIGFFDENDRARRWPPLRLASGQTSIRVFP